MNKTENEIRGLPLEEKQKLVLELKGIQPGDKAYPNAKALIEFITGLKGKGPDGKAAWDEPKKVKVKANADVTVDGADVKKDQVVEVYHWQHRALARFFEAVTAAAAMVALLVLMTFSAEAAPYKLLYSPTTNGNNLVWNGGTNNVPRATTNWNSTVTYTTNTLNLPVVTQTNGTVVISTNTINIITTNTQVINLTPYDVCSFQVGGSFQAAGTAVTTMTANWNWSSDGVNFQTNAFVQQWNVAGTGNYVAVTNIFPVAFGYVQLNNIMNTNAALDFTNVTVCVGAQ